MTDVKMSDYTFSKRMVKRVSNAIHNPSNNATVVKNALLDAQQTIVLYKEDYDEWIQQAIDVGNERKLFIILEESLHKTKRLKLQRLGNRTVLAALIWFYPHHVPKYVASAAFNPDIYTTTSRSYIHDTTVGYLIDMGTHYADNELLQDGLRLFFKQPRSASILERFIEDMWFSKADRAMYINNNPVLLKKKEARKILMRFWLLTTKKNLELWKEALYFPGTGAMYKKALHSFENNGMHS